MTDISFNLLDSVKCPEMQTRTMLENHCHPLITPILKESERKIMGNLILRTVFIWISLYWYRSWPDGHTPNSTFWDIIVAVVSTLIKIFASFIYYQRIDVRILEIVDRTLNQIHLVWKRCKIFHSWVKFSI